MARQQIAAIQLSELDKLFGSAKSTFQNSIATLPAPMRQDFNREVGFARDIVFRGPSAEKLRIANRDTLISVIRNIASVGLTLNPIKQHCTIVPRWNDSVGEYEAHYMPMYRGLVWLATQAGVQDIAVDVVYSGDQFSIERTHEGDHYRHAIDVVNPREEGGFRGVYVAARMPGSKLPKVEWIPAADILKMRNASDSYKDKHGNVRPNSPWVLWFDEQAKKSGLKRASKRWEEAIMHPAWDAFQNAVAHDNRMEGVIQPDPGRDIDGTATAVDDPPLTAEEVAQVEAAFKAAKVRISRICDAYNVKSIAEIPQSKFPELMERAKNAQQAAEERAKQKSGGKPGQQASPDQKNDDKSGDAPADEQSES